MQCAPVYCPALCLSNAPLVFSSESIFCVAAATSGGVAKAGYGAAEDPASVAVEERGGSHAA